MSSAPVDDEELDLELDVLASKQIQELRSASKEACRIFNKSLVEIEKIVFLHEKKVGISNHLSSIP